MTESTSGKTLTAWQQMIQGASSYLPMSLSGRGPYLSIKIPRGKVAALKRNEPMVKPRFKISSCSTQLGHTPLSEDVVLVWTVSLSVDRITDSAGERRVLSLTAPRDTVHEFATKSVSEVRR